MYRPGKFIWRGIGSRSKEIVLYDRGEEQVENYIKQFALKNLIASAVLTVIVSTLLSVVIFSNFKDAANLVFSPIGFGFDLERAIDEKPLGSIARSQNEQTDGAGSTDDIDQAIRQTIQRLNLDRKYNFSSLQVFLHSSKYEQSGKYIFSIKPDEIYDVGLAYATSVSMRGVNIAQERTYTHKYVICQLDGVLFFAKVPYSFSVTTGKTLKGIFVPFSEPVLRDIRNSITEHESITGVYGYQFDTTTNFFYEQLGALILSLVSLVVILWLTIPLVSQIISRNKRPIYEKIHFWNADIDIVNEQLQSAQRSGKSYITKDWIITPGLFKTKMTKNFSGK